MRLPPNFDKLTAQSGIELRIWASTDICGRRRHRGSSPRLLYMEIRETTRARSPILLQQERIGLPVNWLHSAVGRAYLAYCPVKERQRIVDLLRSSSKPEDRLARDPARLSSILAEVRSRGYGTRDATHTGGYYGGPPHADGLFSIAVPLRDGQRVLGAINMLWLKTAFSIETFAARHLDELQDAAKEIVNSVRSRRRR